MASSVILGLLYIGAVAIFPYDVQGVTCNYELQCSPSGCNATNTTQFCTNCSAGFGLLYDPQYPTKCAACSPNCTTYGCRVNGAFKCDRCDQGFNLTSTNTCAPCASNCATYGCAATGAGKCDRCDTGYVLSATNTCVRLTTNGVPASGGSGQPSSGTTRSVTAPSGSTSAMSTWTTKPDQGISTSSATPGGGATTCPLLEVGLGIGVPCGVIIIVLLILIIVLCVQNRSLRAYKKQSQDSKQMQAMTSTNAAPQLTSAPYQQLQMQNTEREYTRMEDRYNDTISTAGTVSTGHYEKQINSLYVPTSTTGTVSTGHYETPIN